MKDISNRTLAFLLVATIVVSLSGTFFSLSLINNRFGDVPSITGFALIPNATATVTVEAYSSIKFSQATVNFGTGGINTSGGYNFCTLSTLSGVENSKGCIDFNQVSSGFTIENDGNTNLSVTLKSNVSATEFPGGTNALFLWNVTVNEADSCKEAASDSSVSPNTTDANQCGGTACGSIFESVSTTDKIICPRLLYTDSSDALDINLNVSIPYDAPEGQKTAGLILTGTRYPLT